LYHPTHSVLVHGILFALHQIDFRMCAGLEFASGKPARSHSV